MSRRAVNPGRRFADGGSIPFMGSGNSKSRSSPLLSAGLLILGSIILIGYLYKGSGENGFIRTKEAMSKGEGGSSCTLEIERALPILKKVYGGSMNKVLHIGPDTCSVVSKLLKEENTEAFGVEPYELDDADAACKSFVSKGFVRAADIKFSLPYRPKSFPLVMMSDVVDYLSPRYLNKTLPELARLSTDGVVIISGYPAQKKAKGVAITKFGRPAKFRSASWWIKYFKQNGLRENEAATKKFEQVSTKLSYKPACQVFHLKSH